MEPEGDHISDERVARPGRNGKTRADQLSIDRGAKLIGMMRAELWPLLSSCGPSTKAEREQVLGYSPETGV